MQHGRSKIADVLALREVLVAGRAVLRSLLKDRIFDFTVANTGSAKAEEIQTMSIHHDRHQHREAKSHFCATLDLRRIWIDSINNEIYESRSIRMNLITKGRTLHLVFHSNTT